MLEISRPFPAWGVPLIWEWTKTFRARLADDFAPQNMDEFVRAWESAREGRETWQVLRDGELGGVVSLGPPSPVTRQISFVFKPTFWDREIPPTAVRQVLETVGGVKVVLPVLRGNRAVIALATQLGARREAVLRAQTTRLGQPADVVVMGFAKGRA